MTGVNYQRGYVLSVPNADRNHTLWPRPMHFLQSAKDDGPVQSKWSTPQRHMKSTSILLIFALLTTVHLGLGQRGRHVGETRTRSQHERRVGLSSGAAVSSARSAGAGSGSFGSMDSSFSSSAGSGSGDTCPPVINFYGSGSGYSTEDDSTDKDASETEKDIPDDVSSATGSGSFTDDTDDETSSVAGYGSSTGQDSPSSTDMGSGSFAGSGSYDDPREYNYQCSDRGAHLDEYGYIDWENPTDCVKCDEWIIGVPGMRINISFPHFNIESGRSNDLLTICDDAVCVDQVRDPEYFPCIWESRCNDDSSSSNAGSSGDASSSDGGSSFVGATSASETDGTGSGSGATVGFINRRAGSFPGQGASSEGSGWIDGSSDGRGTGSSGGSGVGSSGGSRGGDQLPAPRRQLILTAPVFVHIRAKDGCCDDDSFRLAWAPHRLEADASDSEDSGSEEDDEDDFEELSRGSDSETDDEGNTTRYKLEVTTTLGGITVEQFKAHEGTFKEEVGNLLNTSASNINVTSVEEVQPQRRARVLLQNSTGTENSTGSQNSTAIVVNYEVLGLESMEAAVAVANTLVERKGELAANLQRTEGFAGLTSLETEIKTDLDRFTPEKSPVIDAGHVVRSSMALIWGSVLAFGLGVPAVH